MYGLDAPRSVAVVMRWAARRDFAALVLAVSGAGAMLRGLAEGSGSNGVDV